MVLGKFSTGGSLSNCERSEQTKRLREAFRGSSELAITINAQFQSLFGQNLYVGLDTILEVAKGQCSLA